MRYYATFDYPEAPESTWTEAFPTWEDRYRAIVEAHRDGAEVLEVWRAPYNRLTIKGLHIKQVRSRRHYRKLCRLVIGGWLNAK